MTRYNREDGKRVAGMSRAAKVVSFIGSFLGAFLLWIYAIGYDNTFFDRTFSGVEIEIVGADTLSSTKNYSLAQWQEFPVINVVAKGKRSQLNELSPEDFRAVVDVSKISEAGEQPVEITVIAPNGIKVESQSLDTVTVEVDEFTQVNKEVTVDATDGYVLGEGLKIVSMTASPSFVSISGPKRIIDKIAGVYVKCNFDGEITQNRGAHGKIELRDEYGNVIDHPYLSVSETEADVSVTVKKQKTIAIEVMLNGGIYEAKEVATVYPTTITVSGSPDAVESIPNGKLVIEINETEYGWGTHVIESVIKLPEGVSNESGNSKAIITLSLPEFSVRKYTISADKISVVNLPEDKTYEILSDWEVTFIGPRDAFNDFDYNLVTATIDFGGVLTFEADGYSAEPQINFGGEHTGIFAQNKHEVVRFRVFDKSVSPENPDAPVDPNAPVNPNDVIEPDNSIDPNLIFESDILQ